MVTQGRDAGVTALVLAGGEGRRMGGADKGLQLFRGKPLVEWVLERLRSQVDEIVISANRNLERYAPLGATIVRDEIVGVGPLAGLQAGLKAARHPILVSAPCDCPLLPSDLVPRLFAAIRSATADVAVANAGGRRHPLCCMLHAHTLPGLTAFLASGGRKAEDWQAALRRVEVSFDDQPAAFHNVNSFEDLAELERACRK